jgi:NAD(P)-dependent dehydrogenase (short-subunit alcohol dehydrogenase family)
MRSVVISGASTGIGKASAMRLDRLGFRVFAGVRNADDEGVVRRSGSERLTPVMLDVTNPESVSGAMQLVRSELGADGLWGLVNNAGVAVAGPLEFLPVDEVRRELEVNVLGQVAVTQAFLPLLRQARGRIVNIGSVSGRVAFPLLGPYCASKFALEALTASLRMELAPWGIEVSIIAPAGIATPLWHKALQQGEELARQIPEEALQMYGPLIDAQRKRAEHTGINGIPVKRVVRDVVHALTARKPRVRYIIGTPSYMGEVIRLLPDRLRERLILREMARR